MESTGASVQYAMVAKSLKVYGGGGAAQRWKLTYSLLPRLEQEKQHQAGKRSRSGGSDGGDVPREIRRQQKRSKSDQLLQQRGQLHHESERVRDTSLYCEEELIEDYSEGEGGGIGSSYGNIANRATFDLPDPCEYYPEQLEEAYPSDFFIDGGFIDELLQGSAELGPQLNIGDPWEERIRQNIPGDTSLTFSNLREAHGQAKATNKGKGKERYHL